MYRRFGKRLFDLALVIPALVVLSPVLAALAVAVRWKLGSPVLFRQQRPGRDGKSFTVIKFRTMTDARDANGQLLPDGQRLTSFGSFLRRYSLDELPELFNVLQGTMSIVGPRPLLTRYYPYFTAREQRRHSVLPGITGWAQVNGRNEASWNERLENDVWYVGHLSLWLDLKILFLTVRKALHSEGVVVDARSIMLNLDEERADWVQEGLDNTYLVNGH